MTRSVIAAEWRARLGAAGVDGPESLLSAPGQGALAGSWAPLSKPGLGGRERWRWTLADDAVLFVKRYARIPWSAQWDRFFRQTAVHSRAHWEFSVSQRLLDAHIPAPAPVAFAEVMRGAIERRSAVLLGQVPGDAFDRVWERLGAARAPATLGTARFEVVRRLARLVAAFHETGLCHRDLYLCHIFVQLDPAGAVPPRFALIDLARAHSPMWRRGRWLVKDLAQLDASARRIGASRADRLRFLRTYLGLERGAPRVALYARRIVRKSNAILARDARKGLAPRSTPAAAAAAPAPAERP